MPLRECECGKPTCIWCAPPALPSETGPSAEEQAQDELAKMHHGGGYWDPTAILTRLVSEAKRSAHLEDARAGCAHCGQGLVPIHDVVDGWVHDEDGADCKRPEVWDALSLPPGNPSGTIKSTASELPDGKTR